MKRSDIRNGTIHVIQGKTGAELYVKLHPALVRAIKAGPAKGLYLIGEERSGRPVARDALTVLMKRAAWLDCQRDAFRTASARPRCAVSPSVGQPRNRSRPYQATAAFRRLPEKIYPSGA
jgi:hypothetical protein